VLADFEADIQQFLSKIPHFNEEQVNTAAKEVFLSILFIFLF